MSRPPSARRHRLLFAITTSDFGGTESYLARLVKGLVQEKFEPLVLSLCPAGRIGKEIEAAGIRVESFGMAAKPKPHQMLAAIFRLRSFVRREKIALVQALLYRANVIAAVALLGTGIPLVTGQRSLIPAGRKNDARLQRWTRNWADKVVAVSEAVAAELRATESLADEKLVVIQNGIDLEKFRIGEAEADRRRQIARDAWRIKEGEIVIGAVGRLHPPKGLKYLIEAFALASLEEPNLRLVIAGDGPEREDLEKLAREQAPGTIFLGYQADPLPLYPGFDIYVLPSLAEGSPNALLEAMACGLPSVASRVGGVPEATAENETGLMVPPADPRALAMALLSIAREPQKRKVMGQAARDKVEAEFDLGKKIRQHEDLYRGLLSAK
jgi:glycosyltransferase involved in cell wall biosynthesis